jgi:hypothetical protein
MQTYDEAVFKPGPRLNLVLAPNGELFINTLNEPKIKDPAVEELSVLFSLLLANTPLNGHFLDCAGTGKSSLTCALCLGLAGHQNVRPLSPLHLMC